MTLQEAYKSCKQGNFVSHNNFDSKQSMHYYNGSFYYEDGANLDAHLSWLEAQEWFNNDGWYVKYTWVQVNSSILNSLHWSTKDRMFTNDDSYELCIMKG